MEDMSRLSPSPSSAFLTPGSAITRERRLSTSSMDSSVSQISSSSRLRRSKRSSSRLSEFDDEKDDVTILSFLQSSRNFLARSCAKSKKYLLVNLRKAKPRPKLVCEGEILEQTNMICRDYVFYKLTTKDLLPRKSPLAPANWSKSSPVIDACITLEHTYPRIYCNVSRKLCMTMTSTKVVRAAMNSVLDVLFEGLTTWGKIVSMFSVCGLFSEECVTQGHAEFVTDAVDAVVDFTNSRLLDWLVSQGGWDCFPCPKDEESLIENFGRVFAAILAILLIVLVLLLVFQPGWTRLGAGL